MGFLFQGMTPMNVLGLLLFIAGLVCINEVTRRSLKLSLVAYVGLPILLAILILAGVTGSPTGKTWFGWLKAISALAGVYGFMLIRFTDLGHKKFAAYFPVTILSLNIAEAVFKELHIGATYTSLVVDPGGSMVIGGAWNILNGISGILCIVTLTGFVGIRVTKDKSKDMVWPDMTWIYIVAYTLWNFSYVLNCISMRSMYAGFAILVAALIAEFFFKQGAWLQHRAQILSFYVVIALAVDYMALPLFNIQPTYNTTNLMIVSLIAFIFNVGAFGQMIYVIIRDHKNPLKAEIRTATPYYQKTLKAGNL